jgi:hypothetical protein
LRHIVSEVSAQIALDTPVADGDEPSARRRGGLTPSRSVPSTLTAASSDARGLLRRSSVDVG